MNRYVKNWFAGCTSQEQRILLFTGVLVFLLLFYWALWRPFVDRGQAYYQAAQEKRQLLAWMQQQAKLIQSLSAKGQQSFKDRKGQSLLGLVSLTSKQKGLDHAIRRIQPTGEGEVQIWLEQVSFDQALAWLSELVAYQIRIDNMVVRRGQKGVGVDFDLILKEG